MCYCVDGKIYRLIKHDVTLLLACGFDGGLEMSSIPRYMHTKSCGK